jgi:mono/diheme cytochrome c family protein
MNRRIVAFAILLPAAMVVLGCPKQTGTEAPKTGTPVATPATGRTTPGETKAPDAAALMQDRCTQCHGIDKVEKHKASAEEWGKIVAGMQKNAEKMRKTPITDEEAKQIVEHILATYAQ